VLTEEAGGRRPSRPPHTTERFAAAVEIASTGSTALRRHAQRWSICTADAEDACQRGLEILLTKAPTSDRAELRAWLFTVVKHEALAVRHQRERARAGGGVEELEALVPDDRDGPAERAGRTEHSRRAAEAMTHLKPAELRCMLLKAMGFSYREIAQRTGYSHTKVNRCLTEGRRSFLDRFDDLAAGRACEDLLPLLSAASDGECPPPHHSRLRVHLDACAPCRATLRSYREAPGRLAELLPPSIFLPALDRGGWWSRLTAWLDTGPAERVAALSQKLHGNAELLSAKKAAVVMASTAALAGGAAVEHGVSHPPARAARHAAAHEVARHTVAATPSPARAVTTVSRPAQVLRSRTATESAATAKRRHARARQGEFSFEGSGSAGTSPAAPSTVKARTATAASSTEFGGPGASSGSTGTGEFGP
jgi:RNA polymerase sigma factor (sigma-70 family)